MLLSSLFNDPLHFVMWLAAILFAMTIHEFSHALAATALGDSTPEHQGRLSLNPLAHIDTTGLLLLVSVGFGWGRPVEFNPYQLRFGRWAPVIVGFAGPLANLLGMVVMIITLQFLGNSTILPSNLMSEFFYFVMLLNANLLLFNIIPFPPLDGSHLLMALLPARAIQAKIWIARYGPMLLLGLVIADMLLGGALIGRWFSVVDRSVCAAAFQGSASWFSYYCL